MTGSSQAKTKERLAVIFYVAFGLLVIWLAITASIEVWIRTAGQSVLVRLGVTAFQFGFYLFSAFVLVVCIRWVASVASRTTGRVFLGERPQNMRIRPWFVVLTLIATGAIGYFLAGRPGAILGMALSLCIVVIALLFKFVIRILAK